MANKIIYLSGDAKWAKLHDPDLRYKRWTLDLFLDDASWERFNDSGLQLEPKEDAKDNNRKYIRLARPTIKLVKDKLVEFDPPDILNSDNEPFSSKTLVGNGSKVTCKVSVFDTVKGKGHRLEAVRVDELVSYNPTEVDAEGVEDPF